jgi:hypothetical protein
MSEMAWISFLLAGLSAVLGFKYYRARVASFDLISRFEPLIKAERDASKIIADASSQAKRIREEAAKESQRTSRGITEAQDALVRSKADWNDELERLQAQKRDLSIEYGQARATFKKLKDEIGLLEENLDVISFGVYKPHFTFETSDQYKAALEELWENDKEMIRRGLAATCRGNWEVSGSKKAGDRMVKQYTKLMVRSFNAECDAAIAKVKWNNLPTMSERIRSSFEALNQLGTVMQMEISEAYRDLKLLELNLSHEMEEKKQEEKEEARRVREQMREEEKVQRELAAAEAEAAKEERDTERALDRAKRDAEKMDDAGRSIMATRIQELETQLAAAQDKKERVKAQAELTKCGHVYILSNTGSFGGEVVKIGMTRRLEPRERVAELGDASVPFPFDLHALIYTDNAPALETELHNHFWEHRVNLANSRKEFFRVPLVEVENYLCERGLKCTFNRTAEAKEFRQTCSDRDRARSTSKADIADSIDFPVQLFNTSVLP